MLSEDRKKAVRTAANTLWAIGEEKTPDIAPEVALRGLTGALEYIVDQRTKEAATQVAVQLYNHIKAAQLRQEIAAKDIELRAVQEIIPPLVNLRQKAGDLHQALARS